MLAAEVEERYAQLCADGLRIGAASIGAAEPDFRDPLPIILDTHPSLPAAARREIAAVRAASGKEAPNGSGIDPMLIDLIYGDWIAAVNASPRSIVFVSLLPYFMQLKIAKLLKVNGYDIFMLSVEPLQSRVRPLFAAEFGTIVNTGGSYRIIAQLLSRLQPDVVYVQCWMWYYFLARLCIERVKDAKIVCDFYDLTSLYAPEEELCRAFPRDKIQFDVEMERFILENADLVVTRYPDFVNRHWTQSHGVSRPVLHFQAYPVSDFCRDRSDRELGDPIRLVYAGGLTPASLPPDLFPEALMYRMFERILQQGISVDVLDDPHRDTFGDMDVYRPYLELRDKYLNFRLMVGVTPDRLSDILQDYDFGILLADFTTAPTKISWAQRAGVFATKIHSYLEAGLPVIVNAEYLAMAKLVENNELGLAIASAEISTLRGRLDTMNYRRLALNVHEFRTVSCMGIMIHKLLNAIDD